MPHTCCQKLNYENHNAKKISIQKIMFDDNFSHCSKLLTLGGCMREESIKERFLKKEKKVYKKLSDPLLFWYFSILHTHVNNVPYVTQHGFVFYASLFTTHSLQRNLPIPKLGIIFWFFVSIFMGQNFVFWKIKNILKKLKLWKSNNGKVRKLEQLKIPNSKSEKLENFENSWGDKFKNSKISKIHEVKNSKNRKLRKFMK